jgi:hypothetical protein
MLGKLNRYVKIVSIFFITAALIAVMAGCVYPPPFPTCDLTITSTVGGAVTTPGEGTFTYTLIETVKLVAMADEGYCFVEWTGDVSTIADVKAATTTIFMENDYSITANFAIAIEICDWYGLDAIRDDLSGSYMLMNDLDSTTAGYNEMASPTANGGKGWQPIGTWIYGSIEQPFTGTFDGQGYEISELFINRPDENCVGLFGYLGCGAIAKNIGVVNVNVTGDYYVGGLVGDNSGNVTTCYVTGSVAGFVGVGGLVGFSCLPDRICFEHPGQCIINDCYSMGSVTGTSDYGGVGGLVGGISGPVTNSYSTSTVACSGDWVGGLVGVACGEVTGCYATGSVVGNSSVGGLVGVVGDGDVGCPQPGGSVSNSYALGNVVGDMYVGGLVGSNEGPVTNCYSIGKVVGNLSVGGLVGKNYYASNASSSFWDTETSGQVTSDGGTGKTTAQMQDVATFSGAIWDIIGVADSGTRNPSYIWNIVDGLTYPFLSWQP